jgi:hypothetical protein
MYVCVRVCVVVPVPLCMCVCCHLTTALYNYTRGNATTPIVSACIPCAAATALSLAHLPTSLASFLSTPSSPTINTHTHTHIHTTQQNRCGWTGRSYGPAPCSATATSSSTPRRFVRVCVWVWWDALMCRSIFGLHAVARFCLPACLSGRKYTHHPPHIPPASKRTTDLIQTHTHIHTRTHTHTQSPCAQMSKSKGNFLMMDQCVEEFSADATRLALADAGTNVIVRARARVCVCMCVNGCTYIIYMSVRVPRRKDGDTHAHTTCQTQSIYPPTNKNPNLPHPKPNQN